MSRRLCDFVELCCVAVVVVSFFLPFFLRLFNTEHYKSGWKT